MARLLLLFAIWLATFSEATCLRDATLDQRLRAEESALTLEQLTDRTTAFRSSRLAGDQLGEIIMIHHPEVVGPAASLSYWREGDRVQVRHWQVRPPFSPEKLGRLPFALLLDEPTVRVEKVLDTAELAAGIIEETPLAKVLAPLGFTPDREESTPFIVRFRR